MADKKTGKQRDGNREFQVEKIAVQRLCLVCAKYS